MRSVPAYPATKVDVYGTLDDPEFARRTLSMNTTLLGLYLHTPGYLPLVTVDEMTRRVQYTQAEPAVVLDDAFNHIAVHSDKDLAYAPPEEIENDPFDEQMDAILEDFKLDGTPAAKAPRKRDPPPPVEEDMSSLSSDSEEDISSNDDFFTLDSDDEVLAVLRRPCLTPGRQTPADAAGALGGGCGRQGVPAPAEA